MEGNGSIKDNFRVSRFSNWDTNGATTAIEQPGGEQFILASLTHCCHVGSPEMLALIISMYVCCVSLTKV